MVLGLALVALLGAGGMLRLRHLRIANPATFGETMGTGYSIRIAGRIDKRRLDALAAAINRRLAELDAQMSTWNPLSEISRFNASDELGPFPISADFGTVAVRALELARDTGGAFDPTLQPLLNLWGFGSGGHGRRVPDDAEIAKVKAFTGHEKVWIEHGTNLWKAAPGVQLELAAMAKGYGVDAVAALLREAGFDNWFVEIGGEVVVQGLNPDGEPWKIGIQYPTTNPLDERLQGVLHVKQGAIATSGNYRNHIKVGELVYSHILDPRTGRAMLSDTAGVTVVAPDCATADGMATALSVMECDEALAWAERHPGIEAMLLVRGSSGEIHERFSSGFRAATGYIPALANKERDP